MQKIGHTQGLRRAVAALPEHLVYVGAAALLLDEFLRTAFERTILLSSDFRAAVLVSLAAVFALTITKSLDQVRADLTSQREDYSGIVGVMPPHHLIDLADLIRSCRRVDLLTLSGTKIASLGDSRVIERLIDPTLTSKVRILLANPHSPAIVTRYATDEPQTYETGLDGIERRLIQLHAALAITPRSVQKRVALRVFDCYPTVSILRGDDDLYSTIYGFRLRGGDCPKVHSKATGDYARFLLKHFEAVFNSATPLSDWMAKYNGGADVP